MALSGSAVGERGRHRPGPQPHLFPQLCLCLMKMLLALVLSQPPPGPGLSPLRGFLLPRGSPITFCLPLLKIPPAPFHLGQKPYPMMAKGPASPSSNFCLMNQPVTTMPQGLCIGRSLGPECSSQV